MAPQVLPIQAVQRRLRHLESIVVRNVYCASLGPRLLNLQYTLHWAESEKEFRTEPFYTSETVHDVTTVEWRELRLADIENSVDISGSSFVIRVWHVDTGARRRILVIEWFVDLRALVFVTSTQPLMRNNIANEIFFVLKRGVGDNDGGKGGTRDGSYSLYARPSVVKEDARLKSTADKESESELAASLTVSKIPYSPPNSFPAAAMAAAAAASGVGSTAFLGLNLPVSYDHWRMRAIVSHVVAAEQSSVQLDETRRRIGRALLATQQPLLKQQQRASLRLSVAHLQRQVEQAKIACDKLREAQRSGAEALRQRREALREHAEALMANRQKLSDAVARISENTMILERTRALLRARQQELLRILTIEIFPVHPISEGQLKIVGCHLPAIPSGDRHFDGDEEAAAAALGYAAMAIAHAARYYNVPLRYPVTSRGSRSIIHDDVTARNAPSDYPLFFKGQEARMTQLGWERLARNMLQLLVARGERERNEWLASILESWVYFTNREGGVGRAARSSRQILAASLAASPSSARSKGHARNASRGSATLALA